ncbi:uncharacterized protein BYT42DRAFT_301372 [Radiomyces spectabilis]|uniref:uncharacterized protein n=1 Tax=Radiomyces spectabilis TaxID=64574 RepID=UPI00221E4A32|nr:uncharacterized protein BYT42DRAFT_301372 [Radiomyces spectabilis]KAI8381328.1 hypothetical protein BYT42DRAFT_301372 [Radiomyces spectabilis]
MADDDNRSEDEKIQAMLQRNSDAWKDSPAPPVNAGMDSQQGRSPQSFRKTPMNAMGGLDPMMGMNMMMNPQFQYQQQLQQMLMQQQLQQQQQRQMQRTTTIPPETQKPPIGYVCFKCGQPGHWIYYCPNVPKGQFVPRAGSTNGSAQQRTMDQNGAHQAHQRPTELICRICGKLMKEAVLIPCCGKSFCKECTYYDCLLVYVIVYLYFMGQASDKIHALAIRIPIFQLISGKHHCLYGYRAKNRRKKKGYDEGDEARRKRKKRTTKKKEREKR